ncbi:MAG: dCTP deaminase [Litoreibacter sp.]|uniref:dCTP deaminase n=1 Tax=Litoreibacter sp. TaxID=1969459 RepID=UPI0032980414
MILTGLEINKCQIDGSIIIDPFDPEQVNPNSYDFRLGETLLRYTDDVVDPRQDNSCEVVAIPDTGLVIQRGAFFLGNTREVMGSNHYAPIIRAKSSVARLGLFVHVTADLIDIGSVNQFTLQMYATHDVRIFAGMLVGQVTFWKPQGEISLYDGKYQGSRGPVASRSHLDCSCAYSAE